MSLSVAVAVAADYDVDFDVGSYRCCFNVNYSLLTMQSLFLGEVGKVLLHPAISDVGRL